MKQKFSTQQLVITGMLAAVAGVLMSLEFSIPLLPFPQFYKIDFSDVPSVIALFVVGPWSAVCVELIKIIIKLITVGTNSMYVGEFANIIGIVLYVAPVWLIYKKLGKTKKAARIALIIDVPLRIAMSCFTNACITLPLYAKAMGVSLDSVVQMVGSVNPYIQDLTTFIILATIPFNLVKVSANYFAGYFVFEELIPKNLFEKGNIRNAQKLS